MRSKPARHNDSRASISRINAYEALFSIEKRNAFAQDVISKVIDNSNMSFSDKAFSTKIVLGVVSTKGCLDLILDKCLKNPRDIKANVRCALRISVYEMIYLDKQVHAAVDQGVELVGYVAPKAKGLANSVLRKVASAKKSFPFGDPGKNLEPFALEYGFPVWMAKFLVDTYGVGSAKLFMSAANDPAPVYVALNSVKTSDELFCERALKEGIKLDKVEIDGCVIPECYKLDDRKKMTSSFILNRIKKGEICISDASAQMIANIVVQSSIQAFERIAPHRNRQPQNNARGSNVVDEMKFLELCAGRATKTILLQSAFNRICGSQIKHYTALDNIDFKIKLLDERAETYGIHVQDSLCADATDLLSIFPDEKYDCVFLDSPCSGLGTLRRHPEIRWRCTRESIEDASALDRMLISSASKVVARGGILVYSTCTITPEENQQVIAAFLKSEEGANFKIVPMNAMGLFSKKPSSEEKEQVSGKVPEKRSEKAPEIKDSEQKLYFQTLTTPDSPDSHFCCVLLKISD